MRHLARPFAVALLTICGLVLLPICCAAFAQEPVEVNGIAAVVNGDVITISQVQSLSAPRVKQLRAQFTGEELEKQLKAARELALKDLIDRQLVLQAFKKEKYEIPDHIVEERVHEIIRQNFGGDRNTFIKTLEAQNYTLGEFKQKEMEQMIVQAMRSHNVKTKNIISPTKIEDYYRKHRDEFTSKETIKLRMIMIPGQKDTATAPAQKALAEEVLGRLAGGAEFDRTAQVYSEDSTRDNGGDWGWIEHNTLAGPLEKVAFNMPVGRISNIIDCAGIGPEIVELALKSGCVVRAADYRIIGKYPDCRSGQPTAESARAAAAALEEAVTLTRRGELDAIVTGPVHKARMYEVGFKFPGQTEFFADRCGVKNYAMCLTGGKITLALVTAHIPLRKVARALKQSEIVRVGLLLAEFLRARSKSKPRIAVAGLNPHAGESGKLGREEIEIIAPAITVLKSEIRNQKSEITGPHSPDTVFHRTIEGEFDAVLCMYHDQGLIPLKLHAFHSGVNVTLGLPFARTSPDHGTAFEIAGTGIGRPDSMIVGINIAAQLAACQVERSRDVSCK